MKTTSLLTVLLFATNALAQSAGLGLGWFTTHPSGGHSSGGPFGLALTLGQPAAAFSSGGAYAFASGFPPLLSEPSPTLSIRRAGPNIVLAWPRSANGFGLQYTGQLGAGWLPETTAIIDSATEHTVTLPLSQSRAFYRLSK